MADAEQPNDNQKYDFKPAGDWTSWSSAVVLLALFPVSAACAFVVSAIVTSVLQGLLPFDSYLSDIIFLVVIYYLLLPVVFIPGFSWLEIRLVGRSTRPPNGAEQAVLTPAWNAVIARVGRGSKRNYQLRVEDSYQPNAYAIGGRLVVVTSGALASLPQGEIEALISHELGHHEGIHPIIGLATAWLYLPISWFDWVAIKVHNFGAWLTRISRGWFQVVIVIVVYLIRALIWTLQFLVFLANRILLFFRRRAEYEADATAVALGYGPQLIQAFHTLEGTEDYQGEELEGQSNYVRTRAGDTHPPTHKRIQRIKRALGSSES